MSDVPRETPRHEAETARGELIDHLRRKGAVEHSYRPERHTGSGVWRVVCSCGWSWYGNTRQEVEGRAATHDVDKWEAVEVAHAG